MSVSGVQLRAFDGFGSERCSICAINVFGVEFCTKARASECRFPVSSSVQLLSVADVDSPVSSFNQSIREE